MSAPFVGGLLSATVATYSASEGLLVWPVGLGQLLIAPLGRRRKAILTALWTIVCLAQWLTYFIGYVKPAHHPPLGFSWSYLPSLLGGALFDPIPRGTGRRIVSSCPGRGGCWAGDSQATSCSAVVLVGCDRLCLGDGRGSYDGPLGIWLGVCLSSRYATLTIPLVIACYVLSIPPARDRLRVVGVLLTCATLILMVVGAGHSFAEGLFLGECVWSERVLGRRSSARLTRSPR